MANSIYRAISVYESRLPIFLVTGSPFNAPQNMGLHITDEKGLTVAVSCDRRYCDQG